MTSCLPVLFCLMILLLLTSVVVGFPVGQSMQRRKQVEKQPWLFGHRGNSAGFPENTLLAFEECVLSGCDANEMDVYLSGDGVLMIIHDSTVDRTTNGSGRVDSMDLSELKRLDAGYRFTTDGGRTYPFRDQGLTIPTVEELFSSPFFVEGHGDIVFNIDVKESNRIEYACEQLVESIRRHNFFHRVIAGSFTKQTTDYLRQIDPEVMTMAPLEEIVAFTALYYANRSDEYVPLADHFQVPVGYVRDVADYISKANEIGARMDFWTINDMGLVERLLEAGADGIMTDNVDEAYQVFLRLGYKPKLLSP